MNKYVNRDIGILILHYKGKNKDKKESFIATKFDDANIITLDIPNKILKVETQLLDVDFFNYMKEHIERNQNKKLFKEKILMKGYYTTAYISENDGLLYNHYHEIHTLKIKNVPVLSHSSEGDPCNYIWEFEIIPTKINGHKSYYDFAILPPVNNVTESIYNN